MPRRTLVAILAVAAAAALAQPAGAAIRLFHDSFDARYRSPFGAVPTGTPVRLSVRVTGGAAKAAFVRVDAGDPATDAVTRSTVRMRRRGTLWSATIGTPAQPRILSYAFRVTTRSGTFWYGDDYGDDKDDVHQGGTGRQSRFEGQGFQLTVYDRAFATPSWLQGAVVYEIFVDRFRNGDPTNDYCRAGSTSGCPTFYGDVEPKLHPTWNELVEDARATGVFNRDFFGGDLEGVTEKLDYLKSLGVDAIWLTPIFKARSNHRYDTDDYLQVDPGLGGDAAWGSLVAESKRQPPAPRVYQCLITLSPDAR